MFNSLNNALRKYLCKDDFIILKHAFCELYTLNIVVHVEIVYTKFCCIYASRVKSLHLNSTCVEKIKIYDAWIQKGFYAHTVKFMRSLYLFDTVITILH